MRIYDDFTPFSASDGASDAEPDVFWISKNGWYTLNNMAYEGPVTLGGNAAPQQAVSSAAIGPAGMGGGGIAGGLPGGSGGVTTGLVSTPPHLSQDNSVIRSGFYYQSAPMMFNNELATVRWASTEDTPTIEGLDNTPMVQFAQEYGEDVDRPAQVERKKRKKIAKLKKNASNEEVAVAIARHTENKAKEVDRQTKMMEARQVQEEERIKEEQKELMMSKNRINFYKAQQGRLNKNINEIREEFLAQVQELKQLEGVQEVTVDSEGRVVVTTTPLSVMKESWEEPRVAGRYSIRFDFSKPNISEGVRVLNLTQRFNHYDSPTINNTRCCWGNIQKDVERDFYTQNLLELVGDMMEYVISPHESHGYIGLHGNKNQGWEQFFESPTAFPENYNWEQYDRDHQEDEDYDHPAVAPQLERSSRDSIGLPISSSISDALLQPMSMATPSRYGSIGTPNEVSAETIRRYEQENRELRSRLAEAEGEIPHDPEAQQIAYSLRELGVSDGALAQVFREWRHVPWRFADIISLERERVGGEQAFRLSMRSLNGPANVGREMYLTPGQIRADVVREMETNQDRTRMYRISHPTTPYWTDEPTLTTVQPNVLSITPDMRTRIEEYAANINRTATEEAALREAEQATQRNEEVLEASRQMLESFRQSAAGDGTGNVQSSPQAPQSINGNNYLDPNDMVRYFGNGQAGDYHFEVLDPVGPTGLETVTPTEENTTINL